VLVFSCRGRLLTVLLVSTFRLTAETGYDAWLRYRPIDQPAARQTLKGLPSSVVTLRQSPVLTSAQSEIVRAVEGMLGRTLRARETISEDAIVLAPSDSLKAAFPTISPPKNLASDGYWLRTATVDRRNLLLVVGGGDRGVLYGAFALIRKMALRQALDHLMRRATLARRSDG